MIGALDIIDLLPTELQARLEADSFFDDIPVIIAEEGDVAAMLAKKQAVLTEKSGRRGVAVIILQIVCDDDYDNITFGPMTLKPAFQVVENLELNRDGKGTGKSARRVARRIRDVIKSCSLGGVVTEFKTDKPAIEPVNLGPELGSLVRAYQVNFVTWESDAEEVAQCAPPSVAAAGSETPQVTLATTTDGAAIWYSTDESFPRPNAAGSTLYTTAIDIPETGLTLRCAAYKEGLIASQIIRASVAYE